MNPAMSAVKDACDLACDALDAADRALGTSKSALLARPAERPVPKITLVKVASETYDRVARSLVESGVFGSDVEKIATDLRQSDHAGLLTLLEKLASKAVFLPATGNRGVLVSKPGKQPKPGTGIVGAFDAAAAEVDQA